jgi:hypothetical protein
LLRDIAISRTEAQTWLRLDSTAVTFRFTQAQHLNDSESHQRDRTPGCFLERSLLVPGPKTGKLGSLPAGIGAELVVVVGGTKVAAGWQHTVSHIATQRWLKLGFHQGNDLVTQV